MDVDVDVNVDVGVGRGVDVHVDSDVDINVAEKDRLFEMIFSCIARYWWMRAEHAMCHGVRVLFSALLMLKCLSLHASSCLLAISTLDSSALSKKNSPPLPSPLFFFLTPSHLDMCSDRSSIGTTSEPPSLGQKQNTSAQLIDINTPTAPLTASRSELDLSTRVLVTFMPGVGGVGRNQDGGVWWPFGIGVFLSNLEILLHALNKGNEKEKESAEKRGGNLN